MGTLETILVSVFGIFVLYTLYSVFFSGKKKDKEKMSKKKKEKPVIEKKAKKEKVKKQPVEKFEGEKKIEKVILDPKKEEKKVEAKQEEKKEEVKKEAEEPALELKKEAPKDKSFKIIRKKSEIKINKKAIRGDSRNPSITKVFDKGVRIDGGEDKLQSDKEEQDEDIISFEDLELFKNVETKEEEKKSTKTNLDHYGYREPTFKNHIAREGDGFPNRTPRLRDRTNFKSHLVVSQDNNLSGVAGIGVAKAIHDAEHYTNEINAQTQEMIHDVKTDAYEDRNQSLASMMAMMRGMDYPQTSGVQTKKKAAKDKIKEIDGKTLVIAEAIIKRKGSHQ